MLYIPVYFFFVRFLSCVISPRTQNTMRITLRKGGSRVDYLVSAQELCDPRVVEDDIIELCDANGQLHDVCVDFGGEDIPLVNRHEARIVARMFAAEHNTYVHKNYGYDCPREPARLIRSPTEDAEDAYEREISFEYELNPDLGDPSFGPSHSDYTNW